MDTVDETNSSNNPRFNSSKSTEAMIKLYEALMYDCHNAATMLSQDKDNAFAKRMFVRSVFSLIEGVVFAMKSTSLDWRQKAGKFSKKTNISLGEEIILSELSYDLNDKGEVFEKPVYFQLPKNIRFAFTCIASTWGIKGFTLDVGGQGWLALKKSIPVRNRITHPKHVQDLDVTDDEVKQANLSLHWFNSQYVGLLVTGLNQATELLGDGWAKDESTYQARIKKLNPNLVHTISMMRKQLEED